MAESVEATILEVHQETPQLLRLKLKVDPATLAAYERPGQVIVARPAPDDQLYLAIASTPQDDALEILLGPGASEKVKPEPNKTLTIDPPMGAGYPLGDFALGKDILMFAVGSAIAPLRPVVQHFRADRSAYGRITLYVGAHSEEDFAFSSEFDAWERDRIDVVKSVSKPWVWQRFEADPPPVANAVAYVCGMKPMMEDTAAALERAGLPKDRIGKNW